MNRLTPTRPAFVALTVAALAMFSVATAFAVQYPSNAKPPTPTPNSAVLHTRVYNDCPTSTLTTVNNYPSEVSFDDQNVDCFGFANLHTWHLSTDGVNPAVFDNPAAYRLAADLVMDGTGHGEGGLRVSPWYSHESDGLFNVRTTDGEIACFGGRLPFYSFTGAYGLHYVKGNTIHLQVIYNPHGVAPGKPATIEYQVGYLGIDYTSGPLPFDQGNEAEDMTDGRGQWGELNDARVGGSFKAFLGQGNPVGIKATFTNIDFETTPDVDAVKVYERVFNDCPSSTLTSVNDYPHVVSFDDQNVDCFGFANMHAWRFSEDGGATLAPFNNNANYRFLSDFKIEGTGNGEGGLSVSPWYGQLADGLFNIRSTDGEIACFGGRLPFYSFTGAHGLHYVKGDPIHLEIVYDANGRSLASPATIEYRLGYLGTDYTSGPLPFDEGNPGEDALFGYGLYGNYNDGAAGGNFKAFLGQGTSVDVKATYSNLHFSRCTHPSDVSIDVKPHDLDTKVKPHDKFITVLITPAPPLEPGDIDVSSLTLNGVPALSDPAPKIEGHKLKVRFSRNAVVATLAPGKKEPVWLEGDIAGGCISAVDYIKVKAPHIHTPHLHDHLAAGQQTNVTWDVDPDATAMSLYASTDDGATWNLMAANIANSGTYNWTVPNSVVSEDVMLQIINVYETDETGLVNQSEYGQSDPFSVSAALGVVNGAAAFSMRAQNPVSSDLSVSFSLASSAEASLSVFDVAGRSVVSRQVGGQAGSQKVSLGRLPVGLYIVRLSQAGRSITNRIAVVH